MRKATDAGYKVEIWLTCDDGPVILKREVCLPFVPREGDMLSGVDPDGMYVLKISSTYWNIRKEMFEVMISDDPNFLEKVTAYPGSLLEIYGEEWTLDPLSDDRTIRDLERRNQFKIRHHEDAPGTTD